MFLHYFAVGVVVVRCQHPWVWVPPIRLVFFAFIGVPTGSVGASVNAERPNRFPGSSSVGMLVLMASVGVDSVVKSSVAMSWSGGVDGRCDGGLAFLLFRLVDTGRKDASVHRPELFGGCRRLLFHPHHYLWRIGERFGA